MRTARLPGQVKHYQKYLQDTALCKQKGPSSHTYCAQVHSLNYYEDILKKGGIVQYYLVIGNGRYITY